MADINDWMRGNGTDALQGKTNASLIDDNTTNYIQDPLTRLLANYREGCVLTWTSVATVTIGIGELTLENSAGDAWRMRANTATVVLDITADLDTGTEQVSQQYYVYAVADADATTFTGIISESATFPTGITYAKKIGYFYNDAAGDIGSVGNVGRGSSGSIMQASGTTDISTTSTSYVDMTDMELNFVSTGRPVKMLFFCPTQHSDGSTDSNTHRITVGGVEKVWQKTYLTRVTNDTGQQSFSMCWVEVLAAGTHNIKVQWKTNAGTGYQPGSTYGPRVLIIEEL